MNLWEKCVDFHGHSCGGLSIGFRAALYAMDLLDFDFYDNDDIVCIAENDSCSIDAIQVLTGCSVGKGNLLFHLTGKQAYSFYSRADGKSVRLVLKAMPEGMNRDESFTYLHKAPSEALFDVKPAVLSVPKPAKLSGSFVCDCCGETTGAKWIRLSGDKKLCIDCCGRYDRFNV
jgi:formylmethanofuran dehydrogenase subunit E